VIFCVLVGLDRELVFGRDIARRYIVRRVSVWHAAIDFNVAIVVIFLDKLVIVIAAGLILILLL